MRALMLLLVLVLGTSPAFAVRKVMSWEMGGSAAVRSPSCDVYPTTFPRDGSTNVPRNAHAFVFAGTPGNYELVHGESRQPVTTKMVHDPFRIVELVLPHMEADTTYSVVYADRVLTTFTTGRSDDVTPPDPPEVASVTVTADHGVPIELMFRPSTNDGVMKLTVHTRHDKRSLIVPQSSLQHFGGGCAGLHLDVLDNVCFDVAEIDLAGNRSAATRKCTMVIEPSYHRSDVFERAPQRSRWPSSTPFFMIIMGVACFSVLGSILMRAQLAHSAYTTNPRTDLSTELVRRLAVTQCLRAEIILAMCGAALLVLGELADNDLAIVLAAAPIAFAINAIATAQRLHMVLTSLGQPDATASYDGSCYVFTEPRCWMVVAPSELARAKKAAVPTAKIR